jgi:acetylornithine deacetylase/succinyl-diaminopimelate desuccinylase-like protein
MHITSLLADAGLLNVIPERAQATIDIRVPSHIKLDQVVGMIDTLIAQYTDLSYEIVATSKERYVRANMLSDFYRTLASVIAKNGLQAEPFGFEATTDARFYTAQGVQAIGFTPFSSPANLHGTDESVTLDDLDQGIAILYEFLHLFCTQGNI